MEQALNYIRDHGFFAEVFMDGKMEVSFEREGVAALGKSNSTVMFWGWTKDYPQMNAFLELFKSGVRVRSIDDAIYVEYDEPGYFPLLVTSADIPVRIRFFMTGDPPEALQYFANEETLERRTAFMARKRLYKDPPEPAPMLPKVVTDLFTINRIIRGTFFRSTNVGVNKKMGLLITRGETFAPPPLHFDYVAADFQKMWRKTTDILATFAVFRSWTVRRGRGMLTLHNGRNQQFTITFSSELNLFVVRTQGKWTRAAKYLVSKMSGGADIANNLVLAVGEPAFVHADAALNRRFVEDMSANLVSVSVYSWMVKVLLQCYAVELGDMARPIMRKFFDALVRSSEVDFDITLERNALFRTLLGE